MAEVEVAGDAESKVCEKKDASLPLDETEPEAPERLEEVTPAASVEASAPDSSDLKRKLADLEPFENDEAPAKKQQIDVSDSISENPVPVENVVEVASEVVKQQIEGEETGVSGQPETEKPVPFEDAATSEGGLVSSVIKGNIGEEQLGHVGEIDDEGHGQVKVEAESESNGQIPSTENFQLASLDDMQKSSPSAPHEVSFLHSGLQTSLDLSVSRRIEVPNNKVGVLIGKSGETIRLLQINSGARIQITRDGDNDPHSSTRHVELTGTLENINKAEQLIKDVIAEANAGGSPALIARGFSTQHSGGEQIEIQIPSDKVGVIIGKGGETIKSLQTKSGARIQLLPQNLPNGDASKERTVRVTGNLKQVDSAREMIKDVMNQKVPMRSSQRSNTYNNQNSFRPPRGPAPAAQWGPHGANQTHQTTGYNHQQRGMYQPQTTQYPQSHGSYSQHQPPTRGGGWDPQGPAAAPMHNAPPSGGYGYYNQQGGGPVPNTQPSNPLPGSISSTAAPINYNYGQSQAPDGYGHQASYSQPPPAQLNYGHGYSEPNLYSQQQPTGSQPGPYGQPSSTPSYGPPRGPQPGDSMYQAPPSQYPLNSSMQQPYPYGSSAPAQQAPSYGQVYSGHADGGFSQQAVYPQHGVQTAPGYGQGGQAAPVPYTQPVTQAGGYSQYPSSQPSYGDQTAQANVNYGYQGGVPDTGYAGNVSSAGYAVPQPAGNQPVYSQPQANPSGYYDQSIAPQQGHGGAAAVPAGYASNVSPQPGYGGQYDATQTYGGLQ